MKLKLLCVIFYSASALSISGAKRSEAKRSEVKQQESPTPTHFEEDVEEDDPLDAVEREQEALALKNWVETSKEMKQGWVHNLHNFDGAKVFAKIDKVDENELSEVCLDDIRNAKMQHKECADPWPKSKNCRAAYTIPSYRIGDMILGEDRKDHKETQLYCKAYFPESIGTKYLLAQTKVKDMEALQTILGSKDYADFEKPDSDTVVVHFRGYDIRVFGAELGYTNDPGFYKKHAQQLKEKKFTKMVIATGSHWVTQQKSGVVGNQKTENTHTDKQLDEAIEWTRQKLDSIKLAFSDQGFEVSERVNYNADCDLVYMSNARTFVAARGNYDVLIQKMVRLNGGTVIYDNRKVR